MQTGVIFWGKVQITQKPGAVPKRAGADGKAEGYRFPGSYNLQDCFIRFYLYQQSLKFPVYPSLSNFAPNVPMIPEVCLLGIN